MIDGKFWQFGKGKKMRSIESDDGEMCWIVRSDQMSFLEAALEAYEAATPNPLTPPPGDNG